MCPAHSIVYQSNCTSTSVIGTSMGKNSEKYTGLKAGGTRRCKMAAEETANERFCSHSEQWQYESSLHGEPDPESSPWGVLDPDST